MHHLTLALDAAAHGDHACRYHRAAEPVERLWPHHEIGDTRLVLEGMNMTPLALPGRWRTNTSPAASSHWPSRACMASAQVATRRASKSARRKATGCWRNDNPIWP
jgi:hypothetical protein